MSVVRARGLDVEGRIIPFFGVAAGVISLQDGL